MELCACPDTKQNKHQNNKLLPIKYLTFFPFDSKLISNKINFPIKNLF